MATGAPAAAAAGAAGHVPALRDPQARQRLQVVLVSQNEQPAVSVRMIVRAGAAQDPEGQAGLAMLTATLLDQGAGTRTAEQIADEIDFIGGVLGTGAGTDLSFVNAVVMKDSFGRRSADGRRRAAPDVRAERSSASASRRCRR